jgi:UDP-galactopyranose mutase
MHKRFLIVGAGFSGAVLADRLASGCDCEIEVWDEREHIGGNCHTQRDEQTGIMVHQYGPHIFNTDKKEIWDFVNSFVAFRPLCAPGKGDEQWQSVFIAGEPAYHQPVVQQVLHA